MNSDAKTVKIHPETPQQPIIRWACSKILQKDVVIFPTQYLYGMAADAFSSEGVKKIFHMKKRALSNPLLVLVGSRNQVESLVKSVPAVADKLMDKFWPGNVTLIFQARETVPDIITARTGKIGIRIPWHPVAKALADELQIPITGTSANISGRKASSRIQDIDPALIENAGLTLDAGILKTGTGSTVVDVTGSSPCIVRKGEVSAAEIEEACAQFH